MTALKYGLIGCGMMGREHISNIQLLEGTKVQAIYEPDAEMRARAVAVAPQATLEPSLEALLNREDLDCLVIVSPNYLHAEQLGLIAKRRPLPILVEKPLITRMQDQVFIEELQRTYPCPIWVAMEYRYMPPIARFIDLAEEVTGGVDMFTIREHRFPFLEKVGDWNRFNAKSGGTFVEKCCHFFDLMRLILKSEPKRIQASGGQSQNHLYEIYESQRSDIWDNGYALVDFQSGARAMLELCMFAEGSRYQEQITAVGPKGKIECFVPGPGRFWPTHLGEAPTPKLVVSPREPAGPYEVEIPVDPKLLASGDHNGATFYQHQKFQRVVLGQQEPEVSLNDGLQAVLMGMKAQEVASS